MDITFGNRVEDSFSVLYGANVVVRNPSDCRANVDLRLRNSAIIIPSVIYGFVCPRDRGWLT